MTECNSYGTTQFTLVFSGTTLGEHVHSLRTARKLATAVNPRHNTWATYVVLDGNYPALVWNHVFTIYNEESSRTDYANWYWGISSIYSNKPYSLELQDGKGNTVVSFGDCQLFDDSQKEPQELLIAAAGLLELHFYGTTCPSLN